MPVYFIKLLSFILWTREFLDSVADRREYAPFRIEIGKDIDNFSCRLAIEQDEQSTSLNSSVKKDVLG